MVPDAGGFRRAQYYWQSGSTAGAKSVLGGAFLPRIQNVVFIALGAVVLSITGVEALYADMGHFGKLPIRPAWFSVVLPSLVLNYFGQGRYC